MAVCLQKWDHLSTCMMVSGSVCCDSKKRWERKRAVGVGSRALLRDQKSLVKNTKMYSL